MGFCSGLAARCSGACSRARPAAALLERILAMADRLVASDERPAVEYVEQSAVLAGGAADDAATHQRGERSCARRQSPATVPDHDADLHAAVDPASLVVASRGTST